jgi:hypothetical protein
LCLPQTLTQADIHQILLENQKIIQAIYQNQNLGKLIDCVSYLEILQRNVLHLGRVADMPGFVGADRSEWPPNIEHRWARDEFDRLRIAMNLYGTGNLEIISRFVATKSVDEVVKMMPHFLGPSAAQDPHLGRAIIPMPHQSADPSQNMAYAQSEIDPSQGQATQSFVARANAATIDDPPATGTVTISQLTSMRTSANSLTGNLNNLHMHQQHGMVPLASNVTVSANFPVNYDKASPRYNSMAMEPPTQGGTVNLSMNVSAGSGQASIAPPASMTLHAPMSGASSLRSTISEASSGISAQQAPNGVGTFGSFPTTSSSSAPSITMMTFPGMEIHKTPATTAPTQPAISISMYDVSGGSSQGFTASPNIRSPFIAKSMAGYVPAPGQVHVNMDKTTLFTPSNPPRPGSPRTRTPKSPRSPKSPASTAPHSPKSPKPD